MVQWQVKVLCHGCAASLINRNLQVIRLVKRIKVEPIDDFLRHILQELQLSASLAQKLSWCIMLLIHDLTFCINSTIKS